MFHSGQSLLEQKRIQWAREREEMSGLSGIWGNFDRVLKPPTELRRNSLLPPIQARPDEQRAEESETSGYISDTPPHDTESSAESQQQYSAMGRRDNYWADRKAQKNFRNESRVRGTPDSVLSTPEDRPKWGDRGVGVGHLWEPVVEFPESRLPQVYESYRGTPRWVERGLKLADGNNAEILYIQHDEEEPNKFLLGQNAPLPPEVVEERERKRQKALEHQEAIRKQLEERDRKRKEEKERRLREEKMEEERIIREQELERKRRDEEMRKANEKRMSEQMKENAMKEAIEAAEQKAREDKKRQKKRELLKVNEALEAQIGSSRKEALEVQMESSRKETLEVQSRKEVKKQNPPKVKQSEALLKDSSSQVEVIEEAPRKRLMTDSSSQSDNLGLLNMSMSADRGLALVLDGVPDAVQLALLMPHHAAPHSPRQREVRIVTDAATQTSRSCCSVVVNTARSRRSHRQSSRASGRSDSSDKSTSLERERRSAYGHAHCSSSKLRSRSQPRLTLGERPKWGINRPAVQYMKQSEKDPHYMKRLRRRRRTKEVGTCTSSPINEKLLESEVRLLPYQTDEEMDKKEERGYLIKEPETEEIEKRDAEKEERVREILERGFRMISNPSSPKFVPIGRPQSKEEYEITCLVDTSTGDFVQDEPALISVEYENNSLPDAESQSDASQTENKDDWCDPFVMAKDGVTLIPEKHSSELNASSAMPEQNDSDQSGLQLPISSDSSFSPSSDSPDFSPRRHPDQDSGLHLGSPSLGSSQSGSPKRLESALTEERSSESSESSTKPSSPDDDDSGLRLESALMEEQSRDEGAESAVDEESSPALNIKKEDEVPVESALLEEESFPALNIRKEDEEESSPPSSGRSEPKSNADADDADNDDSDDEDNRAVVSGSFPIKAQQESLNQLTALRMGLQKLQLASETRCSTPLSILSLTEENDLH